MKLFSKILPFSYLATLLLTSFAVVIPSGDLIAAFSESASHPLQLESPDASLTAIKNEKASFPILDKFHLSYSNDFQIDYYKPTAIRQLILGSQSEEVSVQVVRVESVLDENSQSVLVHLISKYEYSFNITNAVSISQQILKDSLLSDEKIIGTSLLVNLDPIRTKASNVRRYPNYFNHLLLGGNNQDSEEKKLILENVIQILESNSGDVTTSFTAEFDFLQNEIIERSGKFKILFNNDKKSNELKQTGLFKVETGELEQSNNHNLNIKINLPFMTFNGKVLPTPYESTNQPSSNALNMSSLFGSIDSASYKKCFFDFLHQYYRTDSSAKNKDDAMFETLTKKLKLSDQVVTIILGTAPFFLMAVGFGIFVIFFSVMAVDFYQYALRRREITQEHNEKKLLYLVHDDILKCSNNETVLSTYLEKSIDPDLETGYNHHYNYEDEDEKY